MENSNSEMEVSHFSPENLDEKSSSPRPPSNFAPEPEVTTVDQTDEPEVNLKTEITEPAALPKSDQNDSQPENGEPDSFEQPVPLDIKIENTDVGIEIETGSANLPVYEDISTDESESMQTESESESNLEPVPEICLASGFYQHQSEPKIDTGSTAVPIASCEIETGSDLHVNTSLRENGQIEPEVKPGMIKVEPEAELPENEEVIEIEVSDLPVEPEHVDAYVKQEFDSETELPIIELNAEVPEEDLNVKPAVVVEEIVYNLPVDNPDGDFLENQHDGVPVKPEVDVEGDENCSVEVEEANSPLTGTGSDLMESDDVIIPPDGDVCEPEVNLAEPEVDEKMEVDEKIDSGISTTETDMFEEGFSF